MTGGKEEKAKGRIKAARHSESSISKDAVISSSLVEIHIASVGADCRSRTTEKEVIGMQFVRETEHIKFMMTAVILAILVAHTAIVAWHLHLLFLSHLALVV